MTSIPKINNDVCFDNDFTSVKSETLINNDFNEISKDDKIRIRFNSYLIKKGYTFDKERNAWIDNEKHYFGPYEPYNPDKHSIWECKYRKWISQNYYVDTVGSYIRRDILEDKDIAVENTTSAYDKKYKRDDKLLDDILGENISWNGNYRGGCKKCEKIEEEMDKEEEEQIMSNEEEAKLGLEFKTFLFKNGYFYDRSRNYYINRKDSRDMSDNLNLYSEIDNFISNHKKWFDKNYIFDKDRNIMVKQQDEKDDITESYNTTIERDNFDYPAHPKSDDYDDIFSYSVTNILPNVEGDINFANRLLTHFNVKNNRLNQTDIICDEHLDYLNKIETNFVDKTFKKDNFDEEKEKFFGIPYISKDEDEYFTQDEMLTVYNKSDIDALLNILKIAPSSRNDYYSVPTQNRFVQLKKDIKPSFIEYMFEGCYNSSTLINGCEPTDAEKALYKQIFTAFSDLFSETDSDEWETVLNKCLKTALMMKRYNMWLLKLLFKEGIRVNIDNYITFVEQSPSSSLLKFIEKHLVDENDNTISAEEMKLKISKKNDKKEDKTDDKKEEDIKVIESTPTSSLSTSNTTSTISSSKISFNLKWTSGSFECNLMNAHTKLIENNGQYKLEVNLNC
jgi:hypothetical protein